MEYQRKIDMNELTIINSANSIQTTTRLTDDQRFLQLRDNWILSLQLAVTSAKAYRTSIDKYFNYCHDNGLNPMVTTSAYTLNSFAIWVNDMATNPQHVFNKHGQYVKTINYSTATIRSWAGKVSQFFKWLNDNGICDDITKAVKLPKVETKHKRQNLSKKGVLMLIDHVNRESEETDKRVGLLRNKLIVYLSIYAGLRMVEISRLKWDDIKTVVINDDRATVVNSDEVGSVPTRYRLMVHSKGQKATNKQAVAVNSELAHAINEYRDTVNLYIKKHNIPAPTSLIFSLAKPTRGKGMNANIITKIVQKIMFDCGVYIERIITPHSLRHTFISKLANTDNMPLQNVVKYARHKHSSTTMRYIHTDDNVQFDELDKLTY